MSFSQSFSCYSRKTVYLQLRVLSRPLISQCHFCKQKKNKTRVRGLFGGRDLPPKMFDEQLKFCKDTTFFHSFNSQTKGGAAYSKVKQSRLLSNTKSVITRKQLCLPRLFRCMRSTGIKSFARNVSVGNLRLKINCLLDLGRFVGKKTAGRSTQLSPCKECFLEDLL